MNMLVVDPWLLIHGYVLQHILRVSRSNGALPLGEADNYEDAK